MDTCRSSIVNLSSNTSSLPVDQNLSYATTPSQATSGTYAQVDKTTRREEESDPNYSRLGPAQATVDPGKQQDSQNQISSKVCGRYEFAEIRNIEIDKQPFEDEEYSCLKH